MVDFGEGGKIQLVVSPSSLVFYVNDATSHKQMLTIYNPYDFDIAFKIYSTAPSKYSVIEPSGVIQSKKCLDLAVRHKEPVLENEAKVDKFRLSFTAQTGGQVVTGKKDIPSTLLARHSGGSTVGSRRIGDFERLGSFETATSDWIYQQRRSTFGGTAGSVAGAVDDFASNEQPVQMVPHRLRASNSSIWLLVAIGLVCILLLFLPTRSLNCPNQPDSRSQTSANILKSEAAEFIWSTIWPFTSFPISLEVSHNCQLVAAYILGLISLAILR